MKCTTMLLIVILLLTGNLFADEQKALPTDTELFAWFNSLSYTNKIVELRKLDNVERAIPQVTFPEFGAALQKNGDLVVFPILAPISIKIAHLSYGVDPPVLTFKSFSAPQNVNWEKWIFVPLACAAMGCLGTGISGDGNWVHYVVSGGIGFGLGLLIAFIID